MVRLVYSILKENGDYLVRHKDVTGFTNSEEQANGTTEYMPYLLEDEFISNGAHFKKRLTGVILQS